VAQGAGLARQNQESCLESIFGVAAAAQDALAHL
jgi:hypothetical protein